MTTLRELLEEQAKIHDCKIEDDEDALDFLRYKFKSVWEGDHDDHRWMTMYWEVKEVAGRFFTVSNFICKTSDGGAESCGYEFEGFDECSEVFPIEVTVIEYYTKEAIEEKENVNNSNG